MTPVPTADPAASLMAAGRTVAVRASRAIRATSASRARRARATNPVRGATTMVRDVTITVRAGMIMVRGAMIVVDRVRPADAGCIRVPAVAAGAGHVASASGR